MSRITPSYLTGYVNLVSISSPLVGKFTVVVYLVCCTIESTNIKLVDLLACRGVDVNAQDKTGGTALSVAALYGRADIASLLLQYGELG